MTMRRQPRQPQERTRPPAPGPEPGSGAPPDDDALAAALAQHGAGRLAAAEALCRQILRHRPDHAAALHLLAVIALQTGRPADAAELAGAAVAAGPEIAQFHNTLGTIRQAEGRPDEAAACFRRALALDPGLAAAHINLGNMQQTQGRLDDALASLRRAAALDPGSAEAQYGLGGALRAQGDLDAAIAAFRRAIALAPGFAEAHYNLGSSLQQQDDLAGAIAGFRRAAALKPGDPEAEYSLALALLAAGALAEGWAGYGWRWRREAMRHGRRPFAQPLWDGGSLRGRTVLVWGEQGIGDEMCFASLLPDAIAEARQVIVECEPRLVGLFARSFPAAEIVPRSEPPHPRTAAPGIEIQAPLGDLARRFRPTAAHFPRHAGYLAADPAPVARWRAALAGLGPQPKVGIAWRSKVVTDERVAHYAGLELWGEILAVPGVSFVNLQYDDCAAELAAANARFGVQILSAPHLDLLNDLDGAAALTAALDLVIAPATSVAVMAGALGVPVWQFVPRGGYWHHHGTEAVPWFPSLRPFYRAWNEDWPPVLARIAAALRGLAGHHPEGKR